MPPPHRSGKARAFARGCGHKKLFALKGGRTLDLMFHEAPWPSDLQLGQPYEVIIESLIDSDVA